MSNFIAFICISIILVLVILIATYFINIPTNDYEKHSAYECGFEPFGDARSFFDIHFYTIGLLFIIFDLEVVFLIPVVIDIANISWFGYFSLTLFLLVVLIGFYYEWAIGLLNWVPKKESATMQTISLSIPLLIIYNSNFIFIIFIILITLSLLVNQLNNLIYRVINLAMLSIIVVGVWAYFTDLTFLYIVYILAFTGAVIMLFLSIILMLPASVTTTSNITLMVVAVEPAINSFIIDYLEILSIYVFILFFTYLSIIAIIKIVPDFFTSTDFIQSIKKVNFPALINLKSITHLLGLNVPTAIYGAFTSNVSNIGKLPSLAIVGLYWQNFLYYLYINIESQLYNGTSKLMYKFTNPVWGKLFMFLEYGYAPAKSERAISFPIPDVRKPYVPDDLKYSLFYYLPYTFPIGLIKYFHGNNIYVIWTNRVIFIINCLFYFIINILFNFCAYIYINDIFEIELLGQLLIIFSLIFIISVPIQFNSTINIHNTGIEIGYNYENIDGLLAIKEIIYENNIIYLLIAVLGLLVALIGSAVFTKSLNK